MRKIRLTESELIHLVKRVISESIPTPAIRRLLTGGFRTTAVNALDDLLVLRAIDDYVVSGGSRVRLTNGNQVLDLFLNNRLKAKDMNTVFNEIFRTSIDDELIDELASWLVQQPNFINTYRNADEDQIVNALTPLYGPKQSQVLAKKFVQGNSPDPFVPINSFDLLTLPQVTQQQAENAFQALRQAYATDKRALKIIEQGREILEKTKPTNPNYRNILLSNRASIDRQLADIGVKKEIRIWFWNEIKKSPASKFAFHTTWAIALLSALAFIYRMFDTNGISAIGRGLEMVLGREITGNAQAYACELEIDWLCPDNNGGGRTNDDILNPNNVK